MIGLGTWIGKYCSLLLTLWQFFHKSLQKSLPYPLPPPCAHLIIQPSTQAFSGRSFLDSTRSCDVTERNSPRTPSQYGPIKYGGLFCQVTATSAGSWKPSLEKEEFLCACHSGKQSLGFLNKDPQNQVLFNWSGLSGLSRAATCIRRSVNVFLQFVPMNLCKRSSDYGMSSKPCNREETTQTCIHIVKICFVTAFLGICKHLLMF